MNNTHSNYTMRPLPLESVKINGEFWAPRMATNRQVTLRTEYQHLKQTGRIDAFDLDWQEGEQPQPHQFWDSDVAKWLQAASYSLKTHPDDELAEYVDEVAEKIISAQQSDGYINTYFTQVEPENRWNNLRNMHELYCAGHLIEAAVAHHDATGSKKLLDAMIKYADYIASVFGEADEKRYGAPGHEEIELALVKLYRVTGDEKHLNLSCFFLDQRGQTPSVFERERDEQLSEEKRKYWQDHLPVAEQTTAEGHSVRAMYLYSAIADVYGETGDDALLDACERIWDNVTKKRMYITGGIGSTSDGERFTTDYHLPNETAYAETCAAIGLVFWAHRMLQLTGQAEYADVMERALYNGVISGISLDGENFFYENPLQSRGNHHRQEWFGCACCPPNIARLIASFGQYVYSQSDSEIYVHLYARGTGKAQINDRPITIQQETNYPWGGTVVILPQMAESTEFALNLRIPGWCNGVEARIDGRPIPFAENMRNGYLRIDREWSEGETVELAMPMTVQKTYPHPSIRADAGCVALQRGPIVYCAEGADNVESLHRLSVADNAQFTAEHQQDLLGGVTTLAGEVQVDDTDDWQDTLYRPKPPQTDDVKMTAVPYCVWDNREPGEMRVWLRRANSES